MTRIEIKIFTTIKQKPELLKRWLSRAILGLFLGLTSGFFLFAPKTTIQPTEAKALVEMSGNPRSTNSNATTPQALHVHATISSVGIVAPYLGDDNQTNTAEAYYRPAGAPTWQAAHLLSPDRLAHEWRGSLVYLEPDAIYEIEVRFQDGDGTVPEKVNTSIKTRPSYPTIGATGIIRVVSNQSELQAVLDSAQPGDKVQLMGGIYTGEITLEADNSGTADHYITIEPVSGEKVIFDGSDTAINGPDSQWTHYASSNKGEIYYTDLSWADAQCGNTNPLPNYIGELIQGEGVRYLLFTSDTESWDNDFLPAPPGKAYYVCDGTGPGPDRRLYVVTYQGDDPNNHIIHIARHTWAFWLRGVDYIRIRGFEIRYFSANAFYLTNSDTGSDNNILEYNLTHGIGDRHYRISGEEGMPGVMDNLIQLNTLYERGYRDSQWQWEVEYHHAKGNVNGIDLSKTGDGNVIRYNRIESGHDAIQVNNHSSNVDVYNNFIYECMDNGIEVDDSPGQNIRVWGNTIENCYSSISLQDWNGNNQGPVYIFRNLVSGGKDPLGRKDDLGGDTGYDSKNAFKVGSDIPPDGYVYIYHNTISLIFDEFGTGDGIRDSGGDYFGNAVTRNNIWHIYGDAFKFRKTETTINLDFDCDNMNDIDPTENTFITWSNNGGPDDNGKYTTLASFQTYTSQELNGISQLSRFSAGFWLNASSPDIDAGCIIPGFNDRGPNQYLDQAPDLGAFEYFDVPFFLLFLPSVSR